LGTNKHYNIAVIGLGYVGLPLFMELNKSFQCVGFDISTERIIELKKGHDRTNMISPSQLSRIKARFTDDEKFIKSPNIYIVTVPTPITKKNEPDLSPIKSATRLIAKYLKKGDIVVFESTVYPGLTEEICVPLLEKSGLVYKKDFNCGYSPERINPGDKKKTIRNIKKIVSASNKESLDTLKEIYETIIDAGIHIASSIKIAEAAKVIENTQRDINIALINELSIIFNQLDIPTREVLDAAGTKWNFLNFEPGLVGGHCIGVDPYYLTHKAKETGYIPEMILAGRKINDEMHLNIIKRIKNYIKSKNIKKPKVLLLGLTFKENCNDTRNSKSIELLQKISTFSSIKVTYSDPYINSKIVKNKNCIFLRQDLLVKDLRKYDVILITVPHKEYQRKNINLSKMLSKEGIIFDLKGVIKGYKDYMSL